MVYIGSGICKTKKLKASSKIGQRQVDIECSRENQWMSFMTQGDQWPLWHWRWPCEVDQMEKVAMQWAVYHIFQEFRPRWRSFDMELLFPSLSYFVLVYCKKRKSLSAKFWWMTFLTRKLRQSYQSFPKQKFYILFCPSSQFSALFAL